MTVAAAIPVRRRARSRRRRQLSEINVTPFVDVVLVVLAIFMTTAPLLTVSVPIDLPAARARPSPPPEQQPIEVTVKSDGSVFLQDAAVSDGTLAQRLRDAVGTRKDARIYLRGDAAVGYGRVMEVMDLLNAAGFSRVALVALPRRLGSGDADPKR